MARKKKTKKRISTGKERKDFVGRMLSHKFDQIQWRAECKAAKDIFNEWPVEFLINVPKPTFTINSLFFFLSDDGRKYLREKLQQYLYKPKSYAIIEGEKKEGEDWGGKKRSGMRSFLNEK